MLIGAYLSDPFFAQHTNIATTKQENMVYFLFESKNAHKLELMHYDCATIQQFSGYERYFFRCVLLFRDHPETM